MLGAIGEGRDVATGLTSLLANADEAVLDPIGTGGAILEGLVITRQDTLIKAGQAYQEISLMLP